MLARASLAEGDLKSARQYAQQACAIVERTDGRWFMAYCLNELGNVASAQRNFIEASQHYQTSYAMGNYQAACQNFRLPILIPQLLKLIPTLIPIFWQVTS